MNIPTYPRPNTEFTLGFEPLDELVKWVNLQLSDADFDNRYYPKFKWFKSEITQVEKLINIGCGQGRETFALMWFFKAAEAMGLDTDEDTQRNNIFVANILATTIQVFSQKFESQVIPSVSKSYSPEFVKELRAWYNNLPDEIKKGVVPRFRKGDVSLSKLPLTHSFDLIYSRYVLDKILDKSESGLIFALQNMIELVKPLTGRIVFVVPTRKTRNDIQIQYNFEKYIPKTLTLIKIEKDEHLLGGSDWPETEPVGYIYAKQS